MDNKKPACPKCNDSGSVKKNGTFRGKQRYFCGKCSKSFLLTYFASVIEGKPKIIDTWVHGKENLSQTARANSISNYYVKKIINEKYYSELKEAEHSVAMQNERKQKAEEIVSQSERQLQELAKHSYGKKQALEARITELKEKLAKCEKLLKDDNRELKELKEIKEGPSRRMNYSKFKKFLRKREKK